MKSTLFFLLLSLNAFAVKENEYATAYPNRVVPHFKAGEQRTFTNRQQLKLNFHSFRDSRNTKTLVILPGWVEPASKYAEVIYDLRNEGFNIYVLDHQGQGHSDRRNKDPIVSYVRRFSDYVTDLEDWLNEVVVPETPNQNRFMLAHSMGGAIGVHYLAKDTKVFKKAVLAAPMLQVNTAPYSEGVARTLTATFVALGQGKNYAIGKGPYDAAKDTFEVNQLTHSQARFEMMKGIFVNDPSSVAYGPSSRWVYESLKATKKIDQLAPRVLLPVLMFQAGQDTIVKLPRQNSFCEKHADCRLEHYPFARHELLMETDDMRNVVMSQLKAFLK